MRRSHGYGVGLACYAASGISIGAMLYKPEWTKEPLKFILASAVFAGVGYYLRNTLYLNDPTAVAEYRREIESLALSFAMKKYSVDHLVKLFDTNTLRTYYEREMGTGVQTNDGSGRAPFLDIGVAIERYGIENLKKLISAGIIPLEDLKARFEALANSSANFTSLWQKLAVSSFNELRKMTVLNVESCRRLFFKEFWYVTTDGRDQTMIGRPLGYNSTAGAPLGLIRALTQYADIALELFGVTKQFIQGAIEFSNYAQRVTLAELLSEGLLGLEERGLVGKGFVDAKFKEAMYGGAASSKPSSSDDVGAVSDGGAGDNRVRHLAQAIDNKALSLGKPRITLWQAEEALRLKRLLDRELVTIDTVAPLFHEALPIKYFTDALATKLNNAVLFYEHWDKYLSVHPRLVPAEYRLILTNMNKSAQRAKKDRDDTLTRAKVDLELLASRTLMAELENLNKSNTSELNEKSRQRKEYLLETTVKAKADYNEAVLKAEQNYQRSIVELHKDFSASILEMKSQQQ